MSRPSRHHGFRRLLEQHRVTHGDVAHYCEITESHLSNYLQNRCTPGTRARIQPKMAELFTGGNQAALLKALARTLPGAQP
jgi:hypothetical protein